MNRTEFESNPSVQEIFYNLKKFQATDQYANKVLKHLSATPDQIEVMKFDGMHVLGVNVFQNEIKKRYTVGEGRPGTDEILAFSSFAYLPDNVRLPKDSSYKIFDSRTTHCHGIAPEGSRFEAWSMTRYQKKNTYFSPSYYDIFEMIAIGHNFDGFDPKSIQENSPARAFCPENTVSKSLYALDFTVENGAIELEVSGYSSYNGLQQIQAAYNFRDLSDRDKSTKYAAVYEGEKDELQFIGWEPKIVSIPEDLDLNKFSFPNIKMSGGTINFQMNLPGDHKLRRDTVSFTICDTVREPLPVNHLESPLATLL